MVEDFADQLEATDFQLTLTGSWLEDRIEYPRFWEDVFLRLQIKHSQEQIVEATLELVRDS